MSPPTGPEPLLSQKQEGVQDNGTEKTDGRKHNMRNQPIHANRHMRVVCIGAGASGLYLAYKLKHYFTDFTLSVYEKNTEISGTWFENRYPGCEFSSRELKSARPLLI